MPLFSPNNPLYRPIAISNIFWIVLVLILLVGNIFLGVKYFAVQKDLNLVQGDLRTQKINGKVLEFTKFFIEELLMVEKEVDFETRLKLENAVRNLEDGDILAQWQKFVESKTEVEAQEMVKNLLNVLIGKIKVK